MARINPIIPIAIIAHGSILVGSTDRKTTVLPAWTSARVYLCEWCCAVVCPARMEIVTISSLVSVQ